MIYICPWDILDMAICRETNDQPTNSDKVSCTRTFGTTIHSENSCSLWQSNIAMENHNV